MTQMHPSDNRVIKTRRIKFSYPSGSMQKHYVQGDLVMSHIVAVLSAMFPEGEDFFVRSVRHFADDITDPTLRQQVAGFTGQEVTHGREHRALNERLAEMGYPTRRVDRGVKRGLAMQMRLFPPHYNLASTAALEHYTATLAEVLLTDPRAQELLGGDSGSDSEVRSLLLWHAYEESEHRAVAFDVFRATGGSERTRIWAMRRTTFFFLTATILHTIASMLGDRATYNPVRTFKSVAALRHSPFLKRDVIRRIRAYNRPGFHPDDFDNTEILEAWSTRLFGEQGQLVDHLR